MNEQRPIDGRREPPQALVAEAGAVVRESLALRSHMRRFPEGFLDPPDDMDLLRRSSGDLAEEQGIRCQRNIGVATDVEAMQRNKAAACASTIGAPTRSMHSTPQLAHLRDIEETVRLRVAFARNADRGGLA